MKEREHCYKSLFNFLCKIITGIFCSCVLYFPRKCAISFIVW